jgi:hypothetical protein
VATRDAFAWGVSIDDSWVYAGTRSPKSEIIPYLVSLRLPRGPVEIVESPDIGPAINESIELDGEEAPKLTEDLCQDLVARLKQARIGLVRCWFPWNLFYPEGGQEAQFPMDALVKDMRSAGIQVLAVIGNGYSRFIPPGVALDHAAEYVRDLASSSRTIVRHYAGDIKLWQIENEPNWWDEHLAVRWRSGLIWLEPGARDSILSSLQGVVREECPDAKVIINLEADRSNVDWKYFAKYCDILGLDLYPGYAHPSRTAAAEIGLASEVKRQTGLPVIVAETGYPSGPSVLGYSEERQAEYVRSACIEAYSCDAVDALCIWRFSDSYWRSFPMQENHFGLLTKEREPKAAWTELSNRANV